MKRLICGALLSCLVASAAMAETTGKLTQNGSQLSEINHKGLVQLQQASVQEKASVNGRLIAKEVQFLKALQVNGRVELEKNKVSGPINVDGRATLKDTEVKAESYFRGVAILEDSRFVGSVTIRGDQGSRLKSAELASVLNFLGNELEILGKTNLKKIIVDPSPEHPVGPVLRMSSETVVEGDIEFRSIAGRVYVEPGTVLKGKVINGQVVR